MVINTDDTRIIHTGGQCMIVLDPGDRRPIYAQIEDKFTDLIVLGVLNEGDPLPSVRQLAAELSINPNTVQRAYLDLETRGVINSIRGKGNYVVDTAKIKEARKGEILSEFREVTKKAKDGGISVTELKSEIYAIYHEKGEGEK